VTGDRPIDALLQLGHAGLGDVECLLLELNEGVTDRSRFTDGAVRTGVWIPRAGHTWDVRGRRKCGRDSGLGVRRSKAAGGAEDNLGRVTRLSGEATLEQVGRTLKSSTNLPPKVWLEATMAMMANSQIARVRQGWCALARVSRASRPRWRRSIVEVLMG
jgi:hypothetical protein